MGQKERLPYKRWGRSDFNMCCLGQGTDEKAKFSTLQGGRRAPPPWIKGEKVRSFRNNSSTVDPINKKFRNNLKKMKCSIYIMSMCLIFNKLEGRKDKNEKNPLFHLLF